MRRREFRGAGIDGIPPAPPIEKAFNRADQWFEKMKVVLASKVPFLTKEEIDIKSKAYHEIRQQDMVSKGYKAAASEFQAILKKEKKERKEGKFKQKMGELLVNQTDRVRLILDVLCRCEDFVNNEKFDSVTLLRKEMGEKFLKSNDLWLAKHFFFSALQTSRKMNAGKEKEKYQAEIHCLLAFLARDTSENLEKVLDSAINHLVICRQLAKNQPWQFRPNVLSIRIKKPITLHGLRNDFAVIDGCSLSLYMIATLLEHEILIGLASQIIHPYGHHVTHRPAEQDLKRAHKFANHALKLAFEVRQNEALLSALMRYGVVLRHCGQYDDALPYFEKMLHHAEITSNQEAFSIALQNIAHCQLGKREGILALESLAREKQVCEAFNLEELEGDALKEFGHFLLLEGHLWEAEECYFSAYKILKTVEEKNRPQHSHLDSALVFLAISSGQKIWSRFAGLARTDEFKNVFGLMDFKNRRATLPPAILPKSFYTMDNITDVYVPFVPPEEEKVQYVASMLTMPTYDTNMTQRTRSIKMSMSTRPSMFGFNNTRFSVFQNAQQPQMNMGGLKNPPTSGDAPAELDITKKRRSTVKRKSKVRRMTRDARRQSESINKLLVDTKNRVSKLMRRATIGHDIEDDDLD